MKELIKVTTNENDEQLVSGRELHEFLEVKDNYTDWFKRMTTYGFDENVDFIGLSEKSDKLGGRPRIDHVMKLDMAKEISMLQRTEKGKQARRYFLQVEKAWNDPDMVVQRAMQIQQKKIDTLQLENESMKPKALFADAVSASHTSILIRELAKLINQNGVDIGEKRLFDWLRTNGYLIKKQGTDWNMPTQKSMELQLFEIKESSHVRSDGVIRITKTPKVTGKGQQYFLNKFLKEQTA
ncbi:phage antirepressor KilAC domain-containing protein [Enterococcus faecalis]|uniref:phage antirepressor KilAC domain-containing protein n=1 Tax=Enterococcus faecalis TaxID=1351 RepID=UPI004041B8B2